MRSFWLVSVVHKKLADRSACVTDGDCRRVGDVVSKRERVRVKDVSPSQAAGKSLLNRFDVYGIGASKQGSKVEKRIRWLVFKIKLAAISFPRVSYVIVSAASDAASIMRGGTAASGFFDISKNPNGLGGWVVLAWEDVDVKLRFGGGGGGSSGGGEAGPAEAVS